MEENQKTFVNSCNFIGVKPIMADWPYPALQAAERNRTYADLLSIDYCGAVSELSAIAQYINNENRMSMELCSIAKTILGIAMAEMIHLQKLGELILLLGGNVDFIARQPNGRQRMWTPEHLKLPENARAMILADIEDEKAAINQYKMHIKTIKDPHINAVLARIILDEEYHIIILQALLAEIHSPQ